MRLAQSLAGQTAIYGLGTMVPRFLNYLITPYLTYSFSTSEYGINTELFAYISFFNILFTYGFETAFFNFQKNTDPERVFSTGFWSLFFSAVIFGGLLCWVVPVASQLLSNSNARYNTTFLYWCVGILVTDAWSALPFAKLRSEQKAMLFSGLKILNVLINLGLTLFFLTYCRTLHLEHSNTFWARWYQPEIGIGYVFLATLVANFCTALLAIAYQWPIAFYMDWTLWKKMWRYAWPLVVLGIAAMINDTLDKVLLKVLMQNPAEAQKAQGIYGACNKLAVIMSIFIQAFRYAYEPYFFKQSGNHNAPQQHARIMTLFIAFCCCIFLVITMNLSWIKYFIGTEAYREGLSTVPILLFAYMMLGIVYNLSIWYKLGQKTAYGAYIALVGASVTLLVNGIFMPRFGYWAAAWATFMAYAAMLLLSYFWGKRFNPIPYKIKTIGGYIGLTLLIFFIGRYLPSWNPLETKWILNNLFIILFVGIVYHFEIRKHGGTR